MAKRWKKAPKYMGQHLDLDGKNVKDDEILEGDQWATWSEFLVLVEDAPAKAAAPAKKAKDVDTTQPSMESAVIAADERKKLPEAEPEADSEPAKSTSKKKHR